MLGCATEPANELLRTAGTARTVSLTFGTSLIKTYSNPVLFSILTDSLARNSITIFRTLDVLIRRQRCNARVRPAFVHQEKVGVAVAVEILYSTTTVKTLEEPAS